MVMKNNLLQNNKQLQKQNPCRNSFILIENMFYTIFRYKYIDDLPTFVEMLMLDLFVLLFIIYKQFRSYS